MAYSITWIFGCIFLSFGVGSGYFIAYHHSDPVGHDMWMIGSEEDKEVIQILPNKNNQHNNIEESHSCYSAGYMGHWLDFCYPSIIVHGVGKCGTSAAYRIISEHPQVLGGHIKENCVESNRTTRHLFSYFKDLSIQTRRATQRNMSTLLSGCVRQSFNKNMIKVLKVPKTVYVILTRNMADYMWAGYNYWCTPIMDKNCTHTGHRTIEGLHHRYV